MTDRLFWLSFVTDLHIWSFECKSMKINSKWTGLIMIPSRKEEENWVNLGWKKKKRKKKRCFIFFFLLKNPRWWLYHRRGQILIFCLLSFLSTCNIGRVSPLEGSGGAELEATVCLTPTTEKKKKKKWVGRFGSAGNYDGARTPPTNRLNSQPKSNNSHPIIENEKNCSARNETAINELFPYDNRSHSSYLVGN